MRRYNRLQLAVFPENGLFHVRGLGAPVCCGGAAAGTGGVLLCRGPDHLTLRTLQGKVEVTVILEEWGAEPCPSLSPDGSAWEEDTSAELLLRGYLAIDTDASHRSVALRLAGGSQHYRVRVRARERHAVAASYDQLVHRYGTAHSEEFRLAEERLRGRERFLIQLWPCDCRRPP